MANLNIAENRLPQDGSIQIKIGGKDIDIRVSIFPTYYGERIVLRLLNKTDMRFDLDSLGFSDATLQSLRAAHQEDPRHHPGHGPDGQRQDHHALQRAARR